MVSRQCVFVNADENCYDAENIYRSPCMCIETVFPRYEFGDDFDMSLVAQNLDHNPR